MVRSIRAVYENGVFRPLDRLEGLAEQSTVRLRVEELSNGEQPRRQNVGKRSGFGFARGTIWISDDFDAPLEEFKDYM